MSGRGQLGVLHDDDSRRPSIKNIAKNLRSESQPQHCPRVFLAAAPVSSSVGGELTTAIVDGDIHCGCTQTVASVPLDRRWMVFRSRSCSVRT